jgi:hypothetical protein
VKAEVDRAAVVLLFDELRSAFPHLRMDLLLEHEHVDLMLDIPEQVGMDFAVNLNLQGDELHMSAGAFWLEWFPCTEPAVVAEYRTAVLGLVAGRYRIVESWLGQRAVHARLQRPNGDGWQTIGTWSNPRAFIPWRRRARVLRNGGVREAG